MTQKSKREIEQAIESIREGPGDVPEVSLDVLIAADTVEEVPGRPLLRLDGQLYRQTPGLDQQLMGMDI